MEKTGTGNTVITFRAPNDVDEMLTKAEHATGSSRTDLILEALRLNLSAVVHRIDRERSRLAEEFLNASPKHAAEPVHCKATSKGRKRSADSKMGPTN